MLRVLGMKLIKVLRHFDLENIAKIKWLPGCCFSSIFLRRRFSSCGFPAAPTAARKYALNSGIVKYLLWRKKVTENVKWGGGVKGLKGVKINFAARQNEKRRPNGSSKKFIKRDNDSHSYLALGCSWFPRIKDSASRIL